MTHTYQITGMTCQSCESKVRDLLLQVQGVHSVKFNRQKNQADISMSQDVKIEELKTALKDHPRYQLSEKISFTEQVKLITWWKTYRPVLLVFVFITGSTLFIQINSIAFDWMSWMQHFMAGFFIVFSFFKLLNLKGFADSYAKYDIIATKWKVYAFIYPFIEMLLGAAFLSNFQPVLTNWFTAILMSVSLVGVLQSVLNKRKIRCACLGDVFNLPMSTITIVEGLLMILMSVATLLFLHS